MKTFGKSFLFCLAFWVILSFVGAAFDYSSDPVHTLKRFWFYHGMVVATWWSVMLVGSLLPALVFTALQVGYRRWRLQQKAR